MSEPPQLDGGRLTQSNAGYAIPQLLAVRSLHERRVHSADGLTLGRPHVKPVFMKQSLNMINLSNNLFLQLERWYIDSRQGLSLLVYPAANLSLYFKENNLVLINKSSTLYDNQANLVIHDSIGKVLKTVYGSWVTYSK